MITNIINVLYFSAKLTETLGIIKLSKIQQPHFGGTSFTVPMKFCSGLTDSKSIQQNFTAKWQMNYYCTKECAAVPSTLAHTFTPIVKPESYYNKRSH